MAKSVHVPMTGGARDALIGTSVLLALFATTVFFRLLGRFRGVGIGVDDILSTLAMVSGILIWSAKASDYLR
jgi:hypothetical protein